MVIKKLHKRQDIMNCTNFFLSYIWPLVPVIRPGTKGANLLSGFMVPVLKTGSIGLLPAIKGRLCTSDIRSGKKRSFVGNGRVPIRSARLRLDRT
jgi:hypothetical protein